MTGTLPTSRAEARARGFNRYLGDPCRNGHSGQRYTAHGDCIECTQARAAAQRVAQGRAIPSDWERQAAVYRSLKPREYPPAMPNIARSDFIELLPLGRLMAGR